MLHDINDRRDMLKWNSNMGFIGSKETMEEMAQAAQPSGLDKSASKATAKTAVINRTII